MSQVRILIAMALSAVASGATAAGIQVSLTDAAGTTQNANVLKAAFPAPASDGTFEVEVDFSGVATGSFSGAVQAVDTDAQPLGSAVIFANTATNLQPLPVSVTVAFA